MTSTTRRINTDFLNDPMFIGFDKMLNKALANSNGVAKSVQTNYPPYNIIKTEENWYDLQLAIAGFKEDELDIEIRDGVLSIKGSKTEEDTNDYIHKGIAKRSFNLGWKIDSKFALNKANAQFKDGLLKIEIPFAKGSELKTLKIS